MYIILEAIYLCKYIYIYIYILEAICKILEAISQYVSGSGLKQLRTVYNRYLGQLLFEAM